MCDKNRLHDTLSKFSLPSRQDCLPIWEIVTEMAVESFVCNIFLKKIKLFEDRPLIMGILSDYYSFNRGRLCISLYRNPADIESGLNSSWGYYMHSLKSKTRNAPYSHHLSFSQTQARGSGYVHIS